MIFFVVSFVLGMLVFFGLADVSFKLILNLSLEDCLLDFKVVSFDVKDFL